MIIPLPKSQSAQPTPTQATFRGAGRVAQSTISMSGVQAPQAIQIDSRVAGLDAAPLQAFGEVGMQIADKLQTLQMERYEAQNRVDIADARLAMDKQYADFENWKLESGADPREWDSAWKERADMLHAQFEAEEKYSPVARQALDMEMKDWRGKTAIRINADAAKATFQKAREMDNAEYMRLVDAGRWDEARGVIEGSKYIPADDKVRAALELRDKRQAADEQAAIDNEVFTMSQDPRRWLQESKSSTPKTAKEMQRMEWLKNRAQGILQDQTTEATDEILNGLVTSQSTGRVMSEEDIERMANGRLSPYALAKLKGESASMIDGAEKARRATPEYQKQTFGRIDAAIREFDPNAANADDKLVDILGGIAQLGEGLAPEMRKRLDAKRNPTPADQTIHDIAEDRLKALVYDKEKSSFTTTHRASIAISDGLLGDVAKLQQAGLTEAEARKVYEKAGYDDLDEGDKAKPEKLKEATDLFRSYARQQGRTINAPDEWTRKALESVRDGSPSWSMTDESKESQAAFSYGSSLQSYRAWAKQNPNATDKEASAKLSEIIGAKTSVRLAPKLPGQGPQGAYDGTPEKVSASDAVDMIKQFEAGGAPGGFHSKAYWDYGQWSIGYGTKAKPGEVIDQAEAERRLASELASHRSRVEQHAQKHGYNFAPHQLDALTSFDFNTGSLEQLTAQGTRTPEQIARMMLAYVKADGKTLKGLVNRRRAESNLFQNGY